MNCPSCREALTALLDGELNAEEQRTVETHLTDCPECQKEYDSLLFAFKLTEQVNVIPLNPEIWRRIQREVDSLEFTRGAGLATRLGRLLTPIWRPVVAATGVAAVAMILFVSFPGSKPNPALEEEFTVFMQKREAISRENRRLLLEPRQARDYRGNNPFVVRISQETTNPFRE